MQNIKTEVMEYVPYFNSRSNKKGLDASLAILDPWAVSYLNNMLDQGLQMPLPDWLLAPLNKPRFKQYQGYFLFDSEPKEEAIDVEPISPSTFLQWLSLEKKDTMKTSTKNNFTLT